MSEIQFVTKLPFRTESTDSWFWERLVYSVKSSSTEKHELEGAEIEPELNNIQIATEQLPKKELLARHAGDCSDSDVSSVSSTSDISDDDEGFESITSKKSNSTSMPSLSRPKDAQGGVCSHGTPRDGTSGRLCANPEEGTVGWSKTSGGKSSKFVERASPSLSSSSFGSCKSVDKSMKKSQSSNIFSSIKNRFSSKKKSKSQRENQRVSLKSH